MSRCSSAIVCRVYGFLFGGGDKEGKAKDAATPSGATASAQQPQRIITFPVYDPDELQDGGGGAGGSNGSWANIPVTPTTVQSPAVAVPGRVNTAACPVRS